MADGGGGPINIHHTIRNVEPLTNDVNGDTKSGVGKLYSPFHLILIYSVLVLSLEMSMKGNV